MIFLTWGDFVPFSNKPDGLLCADPIIARERGLLGESRMLAFYTKSKVKMI